LSAAQPDKKLFVLDTNVLIHDPTALFRFQEHDIHLPMVVLEELDRAKKGVSEVARNVRQASRFLDDLMAGASKTAIDQGLHLPAFGSGAAAAGRLFFQTQPIASALPLMLPGNTPDNNILSVAITLQQRYPDAAVTLVSKDINLRIKATILGIHAEDYHNDQVLDDVNLLYHGTWQMPADFWQEHSREMQSWQEDGRAFYRLHGPLGQRGLGPGSDRGHPPQRHARAA
jgi:PhoH-like ATPase